MYFTINTVWIDDISKVKEIILCVLSNISNVYCLSWFRHDASNITTSSSLVSILSSWAFNGSIRGSRYSEIILDASSLETVLVTFSRKSRISVQSQYTTGAQM